MKTLDSTRRDFLKWGTLSVAAVSGFTACSSGGDDDSSYYAQNSPKDVPNTLPPGGKWMTIACNWTGCGGGCLNRGYVVDGVIIRQKTDDTHPDSFENPQYRCCLRGRSNRQMIYSADRLKYPMKRKHWNPGGGANSNGEMRGSDTWERISWQEAITYIADEVDRVKALPGGNKGILTAILMNAGQQYSSPSLNKYGGIMTAWGQASQGAWPVVSNKVRGVWNTNTEGLDRFGKMKSKLVVIWGSNVAWSAAGNSAYFLRKIKENGAKVICINPWFNHSDMAYVDEWIPVRPGTDAALMLGLAHEMINVTGFDQNFLDTYTYGFDAGNPHPSGGPGQQNFKDYVNGLYDSTPKTPEWASDICGTPVEDIKRLAKYMSTIKPMSWKSSCAPARTDRGAEFVHMFYTVGWMTGNVGLPGAEISSSGVGSTSQFSGPALVAPGGGGFSLPANPICTEPRGNGQIANGIINPSTEYGIPYCNMWDAVLNERYVSMGGTEKPIDIRILWKVSENAILNQQSNTNLGIKAYQKVDLVVTSELFMTSDAMYSDIVLPATTKAEWDAWVYAAGREVFFVQSDRIVDPLFECKRDREVDMMLLEAWQVPNPKEVEPYDLRQQLYIKLANANVRTTDNTAWEPLVAITQDDINKNGLNRLDPPLGAPISPHSGRVSLDEILEKGCYVVERQFNDAYEYTPLTKFRAGTPLSTSAAGGYNGEGLTESGRLEIYSPGLVRVYGEIGLHNSDGTIEPIAKYKPSRSGYEESLNGVYPLQFLTIHQLRRVHSTFDNIGNLREIQPDTLIINPVDAAKYGNIQNGDTVLVSNSRGKILQRATVTPTVMPGVVVVSEGSWTDFIEYTDSEGNKQLVDKGGNCNHLSDTFLTGEGQNPWNTNICKVEPWAHAPLPADYLSFKPRVMAFDSDNQQIVD